MRALVRFLTRTAEGATEQRDKVFDTETLTLGRGTDQTIHLRDPRTALEHATIAGREGNIVLRALTLTGVLLNGTITRSVVLKTGDTIRMGDNLLTVIEPPPGFDFALTFELAPDVSATSKSPDYRTRLSETRLQSRSWAWLGVAIVLLAGLLLPAAVLFSDNAARILRQTPLPDDGLWQAGALHPAHRPIADDCGACHTPFRRTPDRKCMACHDDVHLHAEAGSAGLDALSQRRCGACHQEHNEPPALVRRDAIVCTDCHRNLQATHDRTGLLDVSGYPAGHPGFRISMLTMIGDAANAWAAVSYSLAEDDPVEQSGLDFPHAKHLAPEGIKGADGEVVLACADCHLPQGGGAIMRAVEMTRDCQGCHRLDFEPADPQRQAPHAQTGEVLKDLEEYYAWRYLNGFEDVATLGIDPAVLRRPGRVVDRGTRRQLERAAGVRAMEAGDELIQRRACASCHEVVTTAGWPGSAVSPVRLTQRWLPRSRFDHAAHEAVECVACHAAATSESSADVLIPDIDTCVDCHGGPESTRKIATACVDCHGFHSDGAGQWPHR